MNRKIASPGVRVLSGIIDGLVIVVVVLWIGSWAASGARIGAILDGVLALVIVLIFLPAGMTMLNCWMISMFGGTVGKVLTGLMIVDFEGKKLTFKRAFVRNYLGYFASGVFLWAGFLWIFRDPERRGWHDQIADTFVVVQKEVMAFLGAGVAIGLLIVSVYFLGNIISGVGQNKNVYLDLISEVSENVKDKKQGTTQVVKPGSSSTSGQR